MMKMLSTKMSLAMLVGALALGGALGCPSEETTIHPEPDIGEIDGGDEDVEPDAEEDVGPDVEPDADGGDPIETSALPLRVQVLDEAGLPVEGARVTYEGDEHLTDSAGRVEISPADGAESMIVQVEAEGYAPSSAERPVVEAAEGQTMSALVRLLELGEPLSFDAEAEANLDIGGLKIRLPANAFVDGEGSPVTGQAQVTVAGIDPTSGDLRMMPGPLRGVEEAGDEVELLSVYMADISFWQDGEKLQLAEGVQAQVTYPLAPALSGYAQGDLIPYWSFDLERARWIEEGECEVVAAADGETAGEVFCGETSHFSWWNVDKPFDTRNCVEVTVIDSQTGEPVPGVSVTGEGVDFQGVAMSFGATDADGLTCLDFMREGTLELSTFHAYYYSQADGPLTVVGTDEAASCNSDEGGECLQITIELSSETACLNGSLIDEDEQPVEGAPIYGVFETASGPGSVMTTSGSDGAYCLKMPLVEDLQLSSVFEGAVAQGSVSFDSASLVEATCGGDGCLEADDLILENEPMTCVSGLAQSYTIDGEIPRAGLPVYIFAGEVQRSCQPGEGPETWGQILAQGVTDGSGGFALDMPLGVSQQITVSIGECHSTYGQECLGFGYSPGGNILFDVEGIETTVAEGGCQELGEFSIAPMCFDE
ncbi:carboxypeptidase regulatory-like domain-containing protein [Lujinxingia vulgaris]|uniref:Carboxypeptidase regulatory-like domain-containing protein n=1 Tax=Lujinxingia vulgaris TaxID=2600176 RepID=A0A5C6XCC9_9DELT|nr:carboxypeptidase-like regulatory domain-containing protein [Lujinxingia vulgaris]TXD39617.1 carboxypeptidase regulatory-like domain-containing protein [Lujinxingia vulgaris]